MCLPFSTCTDPSRHGFKYKGKNLYKACVIYGKKTDGKIFKKLLDPTGQVSKIILKKYFKNLPS